MRTMGSHVLLFTGVVEPAKSVSMRLKLDTFPVIGDSNLCRAAHRPLDNQNFYVGCLSVEAIPNQFGDRAPRIGCPKMLLDSLSVELCLT